MKTRRDIDDKVMKAERAISDTFTRLFEQFNDLKEAYAEQVYHDAFQDGIEWFKEEIGVVAKANKVEVAAPIKSTSELTEVEKLAQDSLVTLLSTHPGLRTSDITRRITALPLKPALTEDTVKGMINRLKNERRIENKVGRWYSTNAKTKLPDYQVMTYLPDGSKYLGSDISR